MRRRLLPAARGPFADGQRFRGAPTATTADADLSWWMGDGATEDDEDDADGAWLAQGETPLNDFVSQQWATDDEEEDDGEALAGVTQPLNDFVAVTAADADEEDDEDGHWQGGVTNAAAAAADVFGFANDADEPDDDEAEQVAPAIPELNDYVASIQHEAEDADDDEPEQVGQTTPGFNDFIAGLLDLAEEDFEDEPEQVGQTTPGFNDFVAGLLDLAEEDLEDEPELVAQATPDLNDVVAGYCAGDDDEDDEGGQPLLLIGDTDILAPPEIRAPVQQLTGVRRSRGSRARPLPAYAAHLVDPLTDERIAELLALHLL